MTRYLLAGGGTAGHVNPLLAVADRIRDRQPESTVLVLGTKEGLEARLVPERGYELLTIPKLPFPRRPNVAALRFPGRWRSAVAVVRRMLTERAIEVVVGFGGYASAPAYSAARHERLPLAIHEANARAGLANRLGSRYTRCVGVAFAGTKIAHATFVGMPLRREIEALDRPRARPAALDLFGLTPDRKTVLVTGGSLGARSINAAMLGAAQLLVDAGFQVLHVQGDRREFADPRIEHYHLIDYCDRMDLAFAAADLSVGRAGAATVSELSALGVPAVYVPYPVGNGEQRFNAAGVVAAHGALLVDDAQFTASWVAHRLIPLLRDSERLDAMARAAAGTGVRDGSDRFIDLISRELMSSAL
ncbi:MAG: UDP-N-acetylglucosamine--N-acetylmuramyl-(pentapeptide) pyrophosphoryl-undecaprenol N-acetylglucosamine transferase [Microbacteriaceae bacterium]|nr:MAG: UDP-N-acetylglucosamine--N-acetylmuramyl-(pentapeptide) pyrophosphoryl-undecaprenol N-acetylglucosamine transferase [Microbacteriaceae bacterium]